MIRVCEVLLDYTAPFLFVFLEYLQKRCVLVQTLDEELAVQVVRTCLVTFDRAEVGVDSAEDSTYDNCIAAQAILASRPMPLVAIAVWTVWTHTDTE